MAMGAFPIELSSCRATVTGDKESDRAHRGGGRRAVARPAAATLPASQPASGGARDGRASKGVLKICISTAAKWAVGKNGADVLTYYKHSGATIEVLVGGHWEEVP